MKYWRGRDQIEIDCLQIMSSDNSMPIPLREWAERAVEAVEIPSLSNNESIMSPEIRLAIILFISILGAQGCTIVS